MAEQAKPRIIFFGTPAIAARCLSELATSSDYEVGLVVTNPDRPAGRGKNAVPTSVKILAETYNLPVITVDKIRADIDDFLSRIAPFGLFDIGVVVAFGQIIPEVVLHYPAKGSINVHGSLLPRWRGAAPMQRAIMEGDIETGVQLMQMEAGLDTGPIFSTTKISIDDSTTLQVLHDKMAEEGAALLRKDLRRIVTGDLKAIPQDENGITYAAKITNEEARINWKLPARKLLRMIHGISPFPGAFTYLNNQRVKIFSVRVIGPRSSDKPYVEGPGIISFANGHELYVSCGDGEEIAVSDLQLEGKKRLSVKEFLVGTPLKAGDAFT